MGCIPSKHISDTRDISSRETEKKRSINSKYPFPEKDYGGDRLVLQHYLFRYIWQSNFSSPIEELLKTPDKKVLDIGHGSGTWILDMSKEYPKVNFVGIEQIDMSTLPIDKPKNVTFQTCDDLTKGLTFEDNSIDYIHMRFMSSRISEKELEEKVFPDLIRILKPGCYIEIMDIDTQGKNEGPHTQILMSSIQSYYKSKGIDSLITSKLETLLKSTRSLTDVESEESHHPLGSWDEEIGEIALNNWLQELNQLKTVLLPFMKISEDEYREYARSFKDEADMFQTYWSSKRVYGKKIINDEE